MKSGQTQQRSKVVALVGHCGPDSSFLRMAVSGAAPGTRVVMIDSDEDLAAALAAGSIDLLMLNRKLDYGFGEDDGVALLRQLRERHPGVKLMMISNYPETQAEAEAGGALPGFGKREIGSPKAKERIVAALG